jgi:hypothetical protein
MRYLDYGFSFRFLDLKHFAGMHVNKQNSAIQIEKVDRYKINTGIEGEIGYTS